MKDDAQKKAYTVSHDFTDRCEIYFTKTNIEARRWFADEHCDGELAGISCKRCHWADEYYPNEPPVKAYLENGYWFECQNCYAPVHDSSEERIFEGINWVFCNKKCQDDYHAKQKRELETS